MGQPAGVGGPSQTTMLLLLVGGGTLIFLWSASSAVALSIGAGSLVAAFQSWILARDAGQPA